MRAGFILIALMSVSSGFHDGPPRKAITTPFPGCERQEIFESPRMIGGYFGASVAIDGNTAIAGAFNSGPPSAYIYQFSQGAWLPAGELIPQNEEYVGAFGYPVALQGDLAVVGAPFDLCPTIPVSVDCGSVFIFQRTAGQWLQTQKILNPSPNEQSFFGGVVSLDGDQLAIIAGCDTCDADPGDGIPVYIYHEINGIWTLQQEICSSVQVILRAA